MALDHGAFKLLEINVNCAQDLPHVSKMLRTFAVAWIHPDHKLSTRIDHQGHINPAWNYKLVFRVHEKFLRNERAAITFEIYNVAWLRDLPIGTAYLFINHISPPLMQNSPVARPVALHIRRPSGHLQGILHVAVSLIDNNIAASPLRSELSGSTFENQEMLQDDQPIVKAEIQEVENRNLMLQRQPSVRRNEMPDDDDDLSSIAEGNESEKQSRKMEKLKSISSTNPLMATVMHPLPSEVAVNLKKGFYSTDAEEYGSSIFENWSEPSDKNAGGLRSESGEWRMEDQIPLTIDNGVLKAKIHESHKVPKVHEGHKSSRSKRRKHSSQGGGLCSCFGGGFEFTFEYGSKSAKKEGQKIHRQEKLHLSRNDGNMHSFHV